MFTPDGHIDDAFGPWVASAILAAIGAGITGSWVPVPYSQRPDHWYQWSPLVLCLPFVLKLIAEAIL